jgi:hypothetical protein
MTTTFSAMTPPIVREAPGRKPVPATVTLVPPAAAPDRGAMAATSKPGVGVGVGGAGVGVGVRKVGVHVAAGVEVAVGVGVIVGVGEGPITVTAMHGEN